ncbi:glyoxalase/bleomycin resistance/dioxygenase family protein [Streptomyces sp. NPDC059874]|uniref:glyoxalase/bleomycin resistance/dioxygenase family protein n=1 Tax=Streptomyces sp. NPDC059874 TaxID=3346983 RepID=UPI00365CD788
MTIDLLVIYTTRLEACRDFYAGLGLDLVPERHGNGPDHYAATLADGGVLELYPAARRPETGYLRLGLTAPAPARGAGGRLAGRHTLTDPDGRTVVLTVPERSTLTDEGTARDAVSRILGDAARAEVHVFPGGNMSITITLGRHTAMVDGEDATGWGWSVDPGPAEGFTGHDHGADSLEDALRGVRGKIGTR